MTEVLIYKPSIVPSQKILPKLLESIISKGNNVHVLCENEEQMKKMDDYLWTYEQLSFLPHATEADEILDKQPIVLSTKEEVHNNASVAVVFNNMLPQTCNKFSKIIYIADESFKNLEAIKQNAANENIKITYFVQTEKGWDKREQLTV